jgi:pimeloyl-ACP methyl ester carboxylesterase
MAATATHRGYSIAYEAHGRGSAVVLQHGLFSNRRSWVERGVVARLSDAYRTVLIDSLGHGDSDKPDDPAAYRREQRAGDVAAVLDQLGIDRAHYVGYSMGAWIGTGMAAFCPDRLLSLALGGWDIVRGPSSPRPATTPLPPLEAVLARATNRAPSLTEWIQPSHYPALRACLAAMTDVDGAVEVVAAAGVPTCFWAGIDDPWHDGVKAAAALVSGASFVSVSGDHVGALLEHGAVAAAALRLFLDGTTRLVRTS